ncbi:hypothetical protein [Variovorax sp. UMC13]|uniref:hypothetical protein n=1 Tax=Variovorax sp. UMC13 TaxID=1862326 RepID=UPI0015FF63B9|nr:hypothetical protein [Variovorax sp. UMC13]MBB1601559.1 hypothetical protein [Variovorax sp. UMC13]
MARTPTQTITAQGPTVDEAALERAESAGTELARLQEDAAGKVQALALSLGYDGQLSVGTLEDEIRFYQRRSVEALLESGKRLLLLKQMTPHGDFKARVELLGFSDRTAQRFMQAAAKTAKSANLAALSTQVKSASAFLELVTHDDDVLENLQEIDNIERMSPSELRAALRQSEKDAEFNAQKRQKAESERDAMEKKLGGKRPVSVPLDERITPFQLEIAERQSLLDKALAAHHEAVIALEAWWNEEPADGESNEMPASVRIVLLSLDDSVNRTASAVGALQAELSTRFGVYIDEARQYQMATGERG